MQDDDIAINISPYSGSMEDTFSVEYSDPQMPHTSITMTVTGDSTLSGGPCTIQSSHPRTYMTQYGPLVPQSGAWWECKGGWPTTTSIDDFVDQIVPLHWKVSGSDTVSVKGGESTIHDLIGNSHLSAPEPSPSPNRKRDRSGDNDNDDNVDGGDDNDNVGGDIHDGDNDNDGDINCGEVNVCQEYPENLSVKFACKLQDDGTNALEVFLSFTLSDSVCI